MQTVVSDKRNVRGSVLANERVAEDLYYMWMDVPGVAERAQAGQFAMLRCSDGPADWDPLLRRPMSFCRFGRDVRGGSAMPPTAVSFLYNTVGRGTRWLADLAPGAALDVVGPLGNGFSVPASAKRLLCVAGGIGVAPFLSLADQLLPQGREIVLLYGAQSTKRLFSLPAYSRGMTVRLATDDGSAGYRGLVTEMVPEYEGWADVILACGPIAMFRTLARVVRERGVATPAQALLESHMGCGMGVCWGCPVETKSGYQRVCTTGPRFDLAELVFDRDPWMAGRA